MKKDRYYLVMRCECGELMFYRGVHYDVHFYERDGKSFASYQNEFLFECSKCGKQIKFDGDAQKDRYYVIRKCHGCGGIMEHHRGDTYFKCRKCGTVYDIPPAHQKNMALEVDDAKTPPVWLSEKKEAEEKAEPVTE